VKNIGIQILFLIVFSTFLYSQTTELTVGTGIVCPEEEVLVPIDVTDFNDIGAFTIFIGYDTAVLTFIEHLNENSETQGIYSNAMVTPSTQIGISWSSINSANISSGKLIDLKFQYHTENCSLIFNPGCELVNSSLEIVDFISTDGSIMQSDPLIIQNPSDVTIDEGNDVVFSVAASEVDLYQWQSSDDQGTTWIDISNSVQYMGVNTNSLTINSVSYNMNENQFRCQLCYENCCIFSEPAFLFVNQLSVHDHFNIISQELLNVSPNPFSASFKVSCNVNSAGLLIINIYDCLGKNCFCIREVVDKGVYQYSLDEINLLNEFYVCSCELISSSERQICIKKLIKIRD
jgi:hypothetical protein